MFQDPYWHSVRRNQLAFEAIGSKTSNTVAFCGSHLRTLSDPERLLSAFLCGKLLLDLLIQPSAK